MRLFNFNVRKNRLITLFLKSILGIVEDGYSLFVSTAKKEIEIAMRDWNGIHLLWCFKQFKCPRDLRRMLYEYVIIINSYFPQNFLGTHLRQD